MKSKFHVCKLDGFDGMKLGKPFDTPEEAKEHLAALTDTTDSTKYIILEVYCSIY